MRVITKSERKERKERRDVLDKIRASRTNQEQLLMLNHRLGKGIGAKRERARLSTLISQAT